MKNESWGEIKDILDAALDHSPKSRENFVKNVCGANENLRSEVENYLKYDSIDDDVLEENVFSSDKTADFTGRRIGKYKITDELGAGGMGIVFLAERDDGEFERKVAVKLLGNNLFSKSARGRFFRERKILARLRHKNIAAMFDGGATDEGIPYLIMEYVEGLPLNEYAAKNELSLRGRLKIFRKICDAVSFAHRSLIVHRDLKPSNILITKEGEPKLLDFGIAKLLSETEDVLTQTRQRPFTPEYASPEQVKGETVTTASDIYALGIVLYELLTGVRPFKANAKSSELWNSNVRENPTRPSHAVLKSVKSEMPNPKSLRGDLDTIILKALKTNPDERYESVERFADDLRRYENGLPVVARGETFLYRAGKFIRRNAPAMGAAAFVLIAVIGGATATFRQTRLARHAEQRAEQRLNDLRGLTASMVFELNDEIAQSPTNARLELAVKSRQFLNGLATEAETDPQLRGDLAVAYLKLGDLQGRPYHPNIGQTGAARESYAAALEILETLATENPENDQVKFDLALVRERFGYLLGIRFFEWKPAGENLEKSVRLREELVRQEPENRKFRAALADALMYFGDVIDGYKKGVLPQDEIAAEKYELAAGSLEIRKNILAETPSDANAKRALAIGFQRMANAVSYSKDDSQFQKKIEEKLSYHRNALRLREELAASPAAVARDQRQFADQLMMMSDLLAAVGGTFEAEKNLRQSKEIFYSLTLVDPVDAEARYDYGNALWRLGGILKMTNRPVQAWGELKSAETVAEKIVSLNPASNEYLSLLELVRKDLRSLQSK